MSSNMIYRCTKLSEVAHFYANNISITIKVHLSCLEYQAEVSKILIGY